MNKEPLFFDVGNGVKLAYRLSLPSKTLNKLIIISHPLGRFGGSQDDHVVTSLAQFFFKRGYGVLTFDSRGVGSSSGSCSFSSVPEAEDYAAIVNSVLIPLFCTESIQSSLTPRNILICAGYSAGSLSASHYIPSTELSEKYQFQTNYLLVSYPLSVLFALTLTLFSTNSFQKNLIQNIKEKKNVLAIWGNNDQFSSSTKLSKWSIKNRSYGSLNWKGVEVIGADHFWMEREKKKQMLNEVEVWLKETVEL